jgi:hypothetical protein
MMRLKFFTVRINLEIDDMNLHRGNSNARFTGLFPFLIFSVNVKKMHSPKCFP